LSTSAAIALAVSLSAVGEPAPRFPGARYVASFDFRPAADAEFAKPVGWTRLESQDYPFYVEAALTNEVAASSGRSLRVRLNGGSCALFSPIIDAQADYSYVVQGQIKTEGLERDRAFLLLEFLDSEKKLLGLQQLSNPVRGTSDWVAVRIGPVAPPSSAVRFLRLACLTAAGSPPDLQGEVFFDDLWVGRLPRFEIQTSGEHQLFDVDAPKSAAVRIRGLEDRDLRLRFALLDENDAVLVETTASVEPADDEARVVWDLPIDSVGFYQLDVALVEEGRKLVERRFPLTVMRSVAPHPKGDLGLSLPVHRFGLAHAERVLGFSASRWVRTPFWSSDSNAPRLEDRAFADFLERLARRGHEFVGALETPPAEILEQLPNDDVRIADVFSLPTDVWRPSLEAVLIRFGLKVAYWQIGADDDVSYCGLADADRQIGALRSEARRIARDVRVGVPWDWFTAAPAADSVDFLSVGDGLPESVRSGARSKFWPPLAADDLEFQISSVRDRWNADGGRPAADAARPRVWTNLAPLPEDRYDRRTRIVDWARRIVAAKAALADAVFAVNVFDPSRGLIGPEGAPTELFTVWRTLAEHVGPLRYAGSLPLKGPAVNHLFTGSDAAVLVAWSEEPAVVEAVLGRNARVLDLWGRVVQGPADSETRRIPLDDAPVVVVDVDDFLVRFQLGLRFERGGVSSRFGTHRDALVLPNPASVGVVGEATAAFPREWNARPERFAVQIAPGETTAAPFTLTMPQGAPQGEYSIPLEFRLSADKAYRFRLERAFRVGGDELKVVAAARVAPSGDLEVEASLTNLTDSPMSLTGTARTLGRRTEMDFVSNLAPRGSAVSRFVFREAARVPGRSVQLKFEDVAGRREFIFDVPIQGD
jgi:hypothetical protein